MWLNRLLRRGAHQESEQQAESVRDVSGFALATASARRLSALDRLAADPGAASLRAEWEARWDEF